MLGEISNPPVEDFAEAFRSEQVLLITFERKKESLGDNTSFGLAKKILTRDEKTASLLLSLSLSLSFSLPLSLHPESNMDLSNDSTHDRCRVTHPGQPSKKTRFCVTRIIKP